MRQGNSSALSRTLRDLRRRKVFRVAGAYAVTAWLIVEASSEILPRFFEADWVISLIVILALAGFPVSLVLAWMFDITQDGVVRTRAVKRKADEVHQMSRRGIDFIIIGVLLAIVVYLLSSPRQPDTDLQSIAVLPFVDLSQERDQEYFSDGISEQLLNSLVAVDGLRVAARTSSFAFKGKNEDIRAIGEELNVATLLEGSVRKDGNKLRITAQLISVEDGFHLWSQTFDREMKDIFEIQEEISSAIVDALRLTLIGEEPMLAGASPNIEAYELYLLGRHHWHKRTPEDLEKALELFESAVSSDSEYALAYTGIADSYLFLDLYSDLPREESIRHAKAAVAKALELDDRLAEAYASLGLLRMHSLELTAAELALRKAIELQPNSSMAHMWLGSVYLDTSRLELGYNEYHEAYMIDPLHPVVRLNLGQALSQMGRDEEAARHIQFWGTQNPDSAKGDMFMAYLDLTYGRIDTAVARLQRALTLEAENADIHFMLAQAYSNLGDLTEAELWMSKGLSLQEAEDSGKMPKHSDYRFEYHFARGEFDVMERLASDRLTAFPDWKTAELDYKKRLSLVWPGASRILAGDYAAGIEILERVFDEGYAPAGLEPQSVLAAQGLRAYAHKQLGQMDRATEILDTSVEFALKARAEGWRTPGVSSTLAVIYACQEKYDEALAELNSAVDQGWRNYGFTVNYPVTKDLEGRLEYERVMTRMKDDLNLMLTRVKEGAVTAHGRNGAEGVRLAGSDRSGQARDGGVENGN